MTMRTIIIGALSILLCLTVTVDSYALGLKVAPLEYRTTLKKGEMQEGFIDVSNPSAQEVTIKTSIQAFRQINDDGGLKFYDDEQIATGIRPELETFTLEARQALRLYFTIDSTKLPKGDIFAAIFLTSSTSTPRTGVGQLVRVGTLLSIVNQTPGERKAEITGLNLPFLQFSNSVQGSYKIKNVGTGANGFYPTVAVKESLGGLTKKQTSSLVFGGRERENDFTLATGVGLRYIEVGYGESRRGAWVLLLEPWMVAVIGILGLIIVTELVLLRRRRKTTRK
jgi:hypothetical protein